MQICTAWLLAVGLFGAVFYYGAILLGVYKDSLMALFRIYGEERHVYPLGRFLLSLGRRAQGSSRSILQRGHCARNG